MKKIYIVSGIMILFICFHIGLFVYHVYRDKPIEEVKIDTLSTIELKDSIISLKVKENEEINIIRNASNDSTLIIFKKLVSE